MDSSRIIGIHQTRNQLGVQSMNNNNLNEAIGRLLYFQENQKREGVAVLVSPQHIITPIVNVVSPHSKEFSVKDSFVFQSAFGEYVGVKELFYEKTFQYDDWNETSIADQQYCCCAIMQLEKPLKNVRHTGIISIADYRDFFKIHSNKYFLIPTGANESFWLIDNFEQDKYFLSFDVNNVNQNIEQQSYNTFRINTQIPIFVNDTENLGGLCLIGFAQQFMQTSKFQTWLLSKDNFEDLHKWLNGHNASFTIDYETTIDSSRNFKSKELKDSKNTQAHTGKILSLFKLEKYYAASCSEDKQIKVWNWRTGKLKKIFKTDRPCKTIFGINEFLIGVEGNMMIVINWKNKRVENISTHGCEINIVRPVKSKTDKIDRIVIIDIQNSLHLYKFDSKARCFHFEKELMRWDIPNDTITKCLIYSDSQIIFSTGNSGHLSILNWMNGSEDQRFNVKEINQGVSTTDQSHAGILCMMIHPQKQNYIIISCKSGALGVWDIERSSLVLKIAQLQVPIQTMDRQSQNQIIISDGKDYQLLQILQVLSFSSKKYSSYHFGDINFVLHLDDEFFLTADVTGRLRIWQLEQPYLLPDRMIGTANHPVFNILQCPELNSLNNSLSSSTVGYSNQGQQNNDTLETNNEFNDEKQQLSNYSSPTRPNYYQNTYTDPQNQVENQQQPIQDFNNNCADQNQEQQQSQQTPHLQQFDLDQEQTFSNSKFGNESNGEEPSSNGSQKQNNSQQQQDNILKNSEIQNENKSVGSHNENNYQFEQTPQFKPTNAQVSDQKGNQQNVQKMKILNLEQAFNIKRLELEKQQQNREGALPLSSLYSQQPSKYNSLQASYPGSNLQQLEGRLTAAQNQLIHSDRSVESEFSLYKHNRKNSQEGDIEDHDILQPDEAEDIEKQEEGEQETLCLNGNNDSKIQDAPKNNGIDPQNYNSVVSNASEQYLTSIHSHLTYPNQDEIVFNNQQHYPQVNQLNDNQLSNMIHVVNQKLQQINQDTQQAQPKPNPQSPKISTDEVLQLRKELENLRSKINDYQKLNESLDVNYQIVAKKLNLEMEKLETEKKQNQSLVEELEQQKAKAAELTTSNAQKEDEINQQIKNNSSLEIEIQNFKSKSANQQKDIQNKQSEIERFAEQIRVAEQNYQAEHQLNEKLQTEKLAQNQKIEELNKQTNSLSQEMQNILSGQANTNSENKRLIQENTDLHRDISNLIQEKQSLQNENENLIKNNEQIINSLNSITQENQNLNQEVEELRRNCSNIQSELSHVQDEHKRVSQEKDIISRELTSLKQMNENLKLGNSKLHREELVEKINEIVNDQANEQHLVNLTECIKKSGLSVKDLETVQKNIYDKQIKNLYSQIDEQQRENQRILQQFSNTEGQNQNFITDIDNHRKENERLKNELRRSKDSLEHWVKQYSILLDREKLQLKNIESKEELILLLKSEIEKLNSLYIQQLQEQLNQNANNSNRNNTNNNNNTTNNQINGGNTDNASGNNNIIYQQCRKDLLLDEWNSLLSLIDNDSITQFSRIEQTNRKTEKIPVVGQNNTVQGKHQFQPVVNQTQHQTKTPPQRETKSPQNSQIFITNELQVTYQNSSSNFSQTQKQTLSPITQSIPIDKKQHSTPTHYQQQLAQYSSIPISKNQQCIQQSIDIKQSSATPHQISLSTQPEQNMPSQSFQNSVSPNYQSNQISSSPSSSSLKSQVDQNQIASHNLKSKLAANSNGPITSQFNMQQNANTEKYSSISKVPPPLNYQSNTTSTSTNYTNQYQMQYQQQNMTPSTPNNKNTLTISLNNLQPKNSTSTLYQQYSDTKPQSTTNAYNSIQYQQTNPLNNNYQSVNHSRSKSEINQSNQIEKANVGKQSANTSNSNVVNKIETSPSQMIEHEREYRSKSPQSVNHHSITQSYQTHQNQQQTQQVTTPINISQNITSNITNPSTNALPEKSDRSISGLQSLKNMKKNISLTNVSSLPISTLNVANISPTAYNDKPSEFIRRQIEHQQYVQYVEKKNYDSIRSLTPQPQKSQQLLQQQGQQPIYSQIQKQSIAITSETEPSINNNIIRRDTFDPQQNKKDQIESQVPVITKSYGSLSPMGKITTTPIIGNNSHMGFPSQKQTSYTPTPSVKKQKIQEALKMTYVNNKDGLSTSDMIKQNSQQEGTSSSASHYYPNQKCKTEEPIGDRLQDNQSVSSNIKQQQIISGPSYNNPVSPVNHRDTSYNQITPSSSQAKYNNYSNIASQNNSQAQISPIQLRYDTKNNVSTKGIGYSHTDQKQQSALSDIKQSNVSPSSLSQQNAGNNFKTVYPQNPVNPNTVPSSNNASNPQGGQSKYSNNDKDIVTKLNFEYSHSNQMNQMNPTSAQSPYTPTQQSGSYQSLKKLPSTSSTQNINNSNANTNSITQQQFQAYHQHTNSKTNFTHVSPVATAIPTTMSGSEKNQFENVNENNPKKPLYRNYSINSQSSQKNVE